MISKKKVPEIWKDEIKKGYKDAMDTVSKHDDSKTFFLGHRVHHGVLGGAVFLGGFKFGSPYFIGFGLGLMLDDIDDIGQWLYFEKGGDPNSILSYEK